MKSLPLQTAFLLMVKITKITGSQLKFTPKLTQACFLSQFQPSETRIQLNGALEITNFSSMENVIFSAILAQEQLITVLNVLRIEMMTPLTAPVLMEITRTS